METWRRPRKAVIGVTDAARSAEVIDSGKVVRFPGGAVRYVNFYIAEDVPGVPDALPETTPGYEPGRKESYHE